jgi:sec-independent protein translocase protein TatC
LSDELETSKAPLLDHLIELRRRLLIAFAALFVGFGICFYFVAPLLSVLVQPLVAAGHAKLIYTQVFEAFFVQLKVALFGGIMLAFPVIANQLWGFVAPGLYRQEKRALYPFLLATPLLFGLGASLAYFVAIPLALRFLLGFGGDIGGVTQEALPAIGNYLSFVMHCVLGFGVAFLLPVLLLLLESAGIVTRDQLVAARRYAFVGAFGIAMVMTPPDVLSMLLLAIPLCLLYEITLFVARFTERARKRRQDAAAAA